MQQVHVSNIQLYFYVYYSRANDVDFMYVYPKCKYVYGNIWKCDTYASTLSSLPTILPISARLYIRERVRKRLARLQFSVTAIIISVVITRKKRYSMTKTTAIHTEINTRGYFRATAVQHNYVAHKSIYTVLKNKTWLHMYILYSRNAIFLKLKKGKNKKYVSYVKGGGSAYATVCIEYYYGNCGERKKIHLPYSSF